MTDFPRREVIEFEATSNVSANDELIGDDFDTIEGDETLASNEVAEVERIEVLPPINSDGTLDQVSEVRLHDGSDYYPNIRYRWFMLGHSGPSYSISTPRLGQPVLENKVNPQDRPILTATPKFGPDDNINVAVQNDGTQIDQDFTVRVYIWRFKGTEEEMEDYFRRASNLSTTINQSISMSNPFDESGSSFQSELVNITSGGPHSAHDQFTRLTGGVNQNIPKVFPWATWAQNAQATKANSDYELNFGDDSVDDKWQEMYFNHSDGQDAHIIDYLMVDDSVSNLLEAKIKLESRDWQPSFNVEDNDQHELPFVRRLDGTKTNTTQTEVLSGGSLTRPVTQVDGVPHKISSTLQRAETTVWDDEGGVALLDDGTSISADAITVGAQGWYMELSG